MNEWVKRIFCEVYSWTQCACVAFPIWYIVDVAFASKNFSFCLLFVLWIFPIIFHHQLNPLSHPASFRSIVLSKPKWYSTMDFCTVAQHEYYELKHVVNYWEVFGNLSPLCLCVTVTLFFEYVPKIMIVIDLNFCNHWDWYFLIFT